MVLSLVALPTSSYGHGSIDHAFEGPFDTELSLEAGAAQGFTPFQSDIVAVDLFLTGDGTNPPLTLIVDIADGPVDGLVLGSGIVAVPAGITGSPEAPYELHVDLPHLTLISGTYYIVVRPDSSSLSWAASSSGGYNLGDAYEGSTPVAGAEAGFRTYFVEPPITDGDGIDDDFDNCPDAPNYDQFDSDFDGLGDACDFDNDNDGFDDINDNCPWAYNPDQFDTDSDGFGDACDFDADNDGVDDFGDNCPGTYNPDQFDWDLDGTGDACDFDADNDGVEDFSDNCQITYNPDQTDSDLDGTGDACDTDGDNDGVDDFLDNCQGIYNPDQADCDLDTIGDACDEARGSPPTSKDECKQGGWELFTVPRTFKNQGDCIQFVNTGK